MGIDISRLGPAAQKQILQKLQQEQRQQPKSTKYGNVKTQRQAEQEPITFDSKIEACRYDELMLELKAASIRDLRLQPQFTLQESYKTCDGKRVRAIRYVADFSYIRDGALVVEDVKSKATKTAQYQMKRKMMMERFGIEVQEV